MKKTTKVRKLNGQEEAELVLRLYRDLAARDEDLASRYEEVSELEEEVEQLKELLQLYKKRVEYFEGKMGL